MKAYDGTTLPPERRRSKGVDGVADGPAPTKRASEAQGSGRDVTAQPLQVTAILQRSDGSPRSSVCFSCSFGSSTKMDVRMLVPLKKTDYQCRAAGEISRIEQRALAFLRYLDKYRGACATAVASSYYPLRYGCGESQKAENGSLLYSVKPWR